MWRGRKKAGEVIDPTVVNLSSWKVGVLVVQGWDGLWPHASLQGQRVQKDPWLGLWEACGSSCAWGKLTFLIWGLLEVSWEIKPIVRFVWLLGVFRLVIPVEQHNGAILVLGDHCSRWGSWGLGLTTFPRLHSFEVSEAEPWFYDDKTMFSVSVSYSFRRVTEPWPLLCGDSMRPFQSWNARHFPLDRKDRRPSG